MEARKLYQLLRNSTAADWLKVAFALFGGLVAMLGFLLTPLADLPLLWLYGEDVEVEIRGPSEITEGATASFNFVLFGLTRLGMSQGAAIIETNEHLSINESDASFSFNATRAPVELSPEPILIKGKNRGKGIITVAVRTANKPEGYTPKLFTVNVLGRLSTRVTESDLTGEWKIYLQNVEGRMKLVQSGFTLQGTYEFDKPIHGKRKGSIYHKCPGVFRHTAHNILI